MGNQQLHWGKIIFVTSLLIVFGPTAIALGTDLLAQSMGCHVAIATIDYSPPITTPCAFFGFNIGGALRSIEEIFSGLSIFSLIAGIPLLLLGLIITAIVSLFRKKERQTEEPSEGNLEGS